MGVGAVDGGSGVILAAERVLFFFLVNIFFHGLMDRRNRTGRESSPFTSGFDIFTSEYALSDN